MKKLVYVLLTLIFLLLTVKHSAQEPTTAIVGTVTKPVVEFAESNWIEYGKTSLDFIQKGNIDAWMILFDNNARFYWSGGDSLIGKSVIEKFWKDKKTKLVKGITFSNDFWLPVQLNTSEKLTAGTWLLGWFQFEITFKTGRKIMGRVHQSMHMNDNGLIDVVNQYVDTSPIKEVARKKK